LTEICSRVRRSLSARDLGEILFPADFHNPRRPQRDVNEQPSIPDRHAAGSFLGRAIAGVCATFAGIGLGRFAYVPRFPAMVIAGWLEAAGGGPGRAFWRNHPSQLIFG